MANNDKPPFDPSQPFSAASEGGKPAFDPSQPFTAAPDAASESGMIPDIPAEAASAVQRVTGSEDAGQGAMRGLMQGPAGPLAAMASNPSFRKAMYNAPASAQHFGEAMWQMVRHPIDTLTGLKNVGLGAAEKAGLSPTTGHEQYADAFGKMFADRYGGWDKLQKTYETDPVGVMADFSALTGISGAGLARLPGMLGRVGETAGQVARVTDPLSAAGAAVKGVGNVGAEVIGNLGTQTGAQPLKTAFSAGREGGESGQAFLENLRGQAPMQETVDAARQGVANIRAERGRVYREKMDALGKDQTVLNFDDIDKALDEMQKVSTYKGQVISESTADIRRQINEKINNWRTLDPAEFHTAEGFDALKKQIGDIRDNTAFGTPQRLVADKAYRAISGTITKQDPAYAKIMQGYAEASKQLDELTRGLSLGERSLTETSLRKLQAALRDNVSTAFGRREELMRYLVENGSPQLMERLAGQALKPWFPRGLGKVFASIAGERALEGALGVKAAMIAPFLSPRLMGEASYYAGKVSPLARPAAQASFQTGRLRPYIDMPVSPYGGGGSPFSP